ncbi:hypothetical protein PYCCODRAFT_1439381 [Trametes coccinea BRFM310]|uniref:Uncharacterized protein n=1 Tax=Trametes coccinea (strain BRFM310) TaxID=1353009 RepID=A0A1Y2IB51_TRAC3|nr:hypothetical protein PYCCODRAFT_1439381 [Trametes coccinea BRFM310]
MESLNLNNLASSLPTSSYANAEKELTNNFRAAALSLTTLYRSSKTASKRAYNAGYAAACHDLLNMIQQGVSTDVDAGREVTIGRIMDYIEARLEAIKAREEEEDEEEERAAKAGPSAPKPKPHSPTLPPTRARDPPVLTAPPTPYTPSTMDSARPYVAPALASPTPAVMPLRPVSAPIQPLPRPSKSRLIPSVNPKDLSSVPLPSSGPVPFSFSPPPVTDVTVPALSAVTPSPDPTPATPPLTMPMKRRREVHISDAGTPVVGAATDGGAGAGSGAGTSRRRTRSWRSAADQAGAQHQQVAGEAMDVEEEGPQRKRVARR